MGFPTQSQYGFLSYWYKTTSPSGMDQSSDDFIIVNHVSRALKVKLGDDQGNVLERWSGDVLPLDDVWHNVMISWDTKNALINAYLDNGQLALTDKNNASVGSGFKISYMNNQLLVGGSPSDSDFYLGSLAELIFLVGQTPDDPGT